MNSKIFPCRDCGVTFGTAKAFVDHVGECIPANSDTRVLEDAVLLLRKWLRFGPIKVGAPQPGGLREETQQFFEKNRSRIPKY